MMEGEPLRGSITLCKRLTQIHVDFRELVFDACPRCLGKDTVCMAEMVTENAAGGRGKRPLKEEE